MKEKSPLIIGTEPAKGWQAHSGAIHHAAVGDRVLDVFSPHKLQDVTPEGL